MRIQSIAATLGSVDQTLDGLGFPFKKANDDRRRFDIGEAPVVDFMDLLLPMNL